DAVAKTEDHAERARLIQDAADKLAVKRDAQFAAALAGIGAKFARARTAAERLALLAGVVDQTVYVVDRALAKEYGVYFARGLEVTDYHTQDFTVPPGVLKALGADKQADADTPALRVAVSVDVAREQQMLGVA